MRRNWIVCFFTPFLLFGDSIFEEKKVKIISSQADVMIESIDQFPYSDYRVVSVPKLGKFYIDTDQDAIKEVLSARLPWEPEIADLIKTYAIPGTTVVSLGSHIGTHVLTLARCVGEGGICIAVEPQPKIFRELFMNVSLNQMTDISLQMADLFLYWAAVGDHLGKIEITPLRYENEGGTSLIDYATLSQGKCEIAGGTGVFVDLITVDSLGLDNVSLIQMDVESMENLVLDGAKETILRNKPVILLEIWGGWDYTIAPPEILEQIHFTIDKLKSLGYTVRRIGGWDYLATPNHEGGNKKMREESLRDLGGNGMQTKAAHRKIPCHSVFRALPT